MRGLVTDLTAQGNGSVAIGHALARGVETLDQATTWVRAQGPGLPLSAAAGATAYLRLFGGVLAVYLLGRGAAAAHRLRATGADGGYPAAFLDAKVATARFYAEQVLPFALAAAGPAMAGAESTFGIGVDAL